MLNRRNLWMLPAAIGAAMTFVAIGAVLAYGVPKIFLRRDCLCDAERGIRD